jgi:hypothetical protein
MVPNRPATFAQGRGLELYLEALDIRSILLILPDLMPFAPEPVILVKFSPL